MFFTSGASGKESACQCRRCGELGFDLWVWKIPGEGNAAHSSILAWDISWTEEPGGLQSMGSQRVRYSWAHPAQHISYVMPFIFGNKEFNFLFFATLQGLWDLSSPTRDRTWTLALKAAHLNHWTTREFLGNKEFKFWSKSIKMPYFKFVFSIHF